MTRTFALATVSLLMEANSIEQVSDAAVGDQTLKLKSIVATMKKMEAPAGKELGATYAELSKILR